MPAEIGSMFRDLRRALKISMPELSSRLGTRIEVINALERGDLARLPPWPETVRVVVAFTGMAKIDPRPVLGIMGQQMAGSPALAHVPPLQKLSSAYRSAAAHMVPAAAAMRSFGAKAARVSAAVRAGGYGKSLARKTGLAMLAACVAGAAYATKSSEFPASLATLSPPITRLMRNAQDYVMTRSAPVRDGLKWIEVDDPRTRRGDRLDGSHL